MDERLRTPLLWSVCGVVFLVGSVLALVSLERVNAASERIQAGLADLSALRGIERDMAPYEQAHLEYEKLPAGGDPVSLAPLLKECLPGISVLDPRESRTAIAAGWTLLQKEVNLRDAPLAGVMEFVSRAENSNPPWRLARCVVRASPKGPGRGQVLLL